ncbi:histidinol-phosphate transaminase [Acidithiobacillus sp. IBUN Pt1247-S3]|uniref:histidinol-phosphate transaminase n=1 Tax=Acidithiobacillus sp. IBUN Pt1247-S3 TaxID=3166642 RepID=UPI0034E6191F
MSVQPMPWVQGLQPYQPGKPLAALERELGIRDAIKLASNENPLGTSVLVQEAISAACRVLGRYPEGAAPELRAALSRKLTVTENQILLGNGSDEIITMLCRCFAGPGVEVIVSQYAFSAYAIAARSVGAELIQVPATEYGHDLDAMAARIGSATRLIFLANPNNPTGTHFSAAALDAFLAQVPEQVLVVLDEAYAELMPAENYPNGLERLSRYPNLLVTRTFSKAYGLAGLRLGYAIANPELIALLERLRLPFNVNSLAQVAAIAALADHEHLQATLTNNRIGLALLEQGLKKFGLTTLPAAGNFITFFTPGLAQPLYEALLQRGVIVRPLLPYGLPSQLRVSVGNPQENQRFLQTLGEVL